MKSLNFILLMLFASFSVASLAENYTWTVTNKSSITANIVYFPAVSIDAYNFACPANSPVKRQPIVSGGSGKLTIDGRNICVGLEGQPVESWGASNPSLYFTGNKQDCPSHTFCNGDPCPKQKICLPQ